MGINQVQRNKIGKGGNDEAPGKFIKTVLNFRTL